MNFPQQQPSQMPVHRYSSFIPVDLADRTWPNKKITVAPKRRKNCDEANPWKRSRPENFVLLCRFPLLLSFERFGM